MLQASSNSSSPTPSAAASFFARINSPPVPPNGPGGGQHRSFSVGAADGPAVSGDAVQDVSNGPPHAGADVRRSVSLRGPTPAQQAMQAMYGMSSFSAAGSDLASPPQSVASGYAPPAAARHALFSHHARPPPQYSRPFSPAASVMSDPGAEMGDPFDRTNNALFPPSPTGSTQSSTGTGTFSPASAFLSSFGRGRAMSVAGLPEEPPAPDAPGAKVKEYTLGKLLGRGGFSTVRQATHDMTGEVIAIKIVKRDDLSDQSGSVEGFEDEIRIWQELPEHPSLLPLIGMHRTPYATFLFMPLLTGGNLLEVLRREGGSDKTARKWFPGVVSAVSALHEGFDGFEGNMLHGDLKLDNFIADDAGGLRLGDFGMARKVTQPEPPTFPSPGAVSPIPAHAHVTGRLRHSSTPHHPRSRGRQMSRSPPRRRETFTSSDLTPVPANPMPSASLPYAPPELFSVPHAPPSLKRDIWAVGVILYALLTGRLPFTDSFDPRLQMKILRGQYDHPTHLGHEWLEVLHGCLERDVHARWDIRRVRESDAVTGWREVRPKVHGSRSRSRVRIASESTISEGMPIPGGRSRDRSRSRLRHGHSLGHSHSGSLGSTHSHHRGPSYSEFQLPSPALDERDSRFLRRPGIESRSRSASSRRGRMSGDMHTLMSTSNDDHLIAALDDISITRGRSTHRTDGHDSRDHSASSLRVPGEPISRGSRSPSATRPSSFHGIQTPPTPSVGHLQGPADTRRARSRTRLDGVNVPVPGSGPPPAREHRHRSHGHGHGGHGSHGGHGGHGSHSHGSHSGDQSPSTPKIARPRGSPSWGPSESRPPTLGMELDVVDEEERGRRGGRSPAPIHHPSSRSRSRRGRMRD